MRRDYLYPGISKEERVAAAIHSADLRGSPVMTQPLQMAAPPECRHWWGLSSAEQAPYLARARAAINEAELGEVADG